MKLPITFFFCLFLLCACSLSGGQVKINEKSTVMFQGSGVSQQEAKRLGQFLLKQGYFNTFDERIVYLLKKNNRFEVTFLIDKELFITDKENLLPGFEIWHQWISEEIFPNAATRLILADLNRQVLYKIDSVSTGH